MYNYTIYCTEEQTKKALDLGAPIKIFGEESLNRHMVEKAKSLGQLPELEENLSKKHAAICGDMAYNIPTAEQMQGWLRGQGFHFDVDEITMCCIMPHIDNEYICNPICRKNTAEATLAAIDAALEYLKAKLERSTKN